MLKTNLNSHSLRGLRLALRKVECEIGTQQIKAIISLLLFRVKRLEHVTFLTQEIVMNDGL